MKLGLFAPTVMLVSRYILYMYRDCSRSFQLTTHTEFMMDAGVIYKAATSCRRLFNSCVSSVPFPEHATSIRSAQGDFNLWCAAIGVTSVGKSSLDYRLRDHEDIRDKVCNWLASLEASLERYYHGIDGKCGSRTEHGPQDQVDCFTEVDDGDMVEDETAAPDSPLSTASPAASDSVMDEDSGSDSFMPDEAPPGADSIAIECISYIRTSLDRLASISLIIRKAGSKYRFERADRALKEDDFTDFSIHLTQVILRAFPVPDAAQLKPQQLIDRLSDNGRLTAVQKQLIRANILRKNRIEYVNRHRGEKLSTVKDAKQVADSHGGDKSSSIPPSSLSGHTVSRLSRPLEKRAPESNASFKAATTAPSAMDSAAPTATDMDSHFDAHARSTASNLTRVGATLDYPRCPNIGQNHQLICPYCLDILPSSYLKSEQAWKQVLPKSRSNP